MENNANSLIHISSHASRICIITVLYNSSDHIVSYFNSWREFESGTDLIFVDNASDDQSLILLQKLIDEYNVKNVKILKNERNLGFGRANNLALDYVVENNYHYVMLLNDDVILTENISHRLMKFCNHNVIFSPIQRNVKGTYEVNFQKFVGLAALNSSQELIEIDFVQAASWFFSVEILNFSKGYLFDSDFFHYGEDNEFCYRLKKGGGKIIVDTTISLIHNSEEFNHNYPKDYSLYHLNRLRSEALISIKTGSRQHLVIIRRLLLQMIKHAIYWRIRDGFRVFNFTLCIIRLTIKSWSRL